ncbi:acid phosphatase [Pseudonocardia charpentierae]|uniref:Acid phosphatase n=1 Tax=Pseudonocardia charpentierae TaxID=3075545 RepID=A0ABU2N4P3_9PSEU|nr:acid phosphatase [Pseudonocardia sp. DSM 45834]MDT0348855.1 acid phosphatase [Pseudonocardia sp. DSM 45834]
MASHDPASDPGRIVLLRHGQTEWSASGQHTSRTDIPLTDRGRVLAEETAELGRRILRDRPPALVLTSPRARARTTAELAGLHADRVDDRLVEWDYGSYEGLTTDQIRADQPGWSIWENGAPGGESPEQVGKRADDLIADITPTLADGDVVLVGHGHFSRVLMTRWIELPVVEGARLMMDAPAWAVLGHYHGDVRCLDHVNLHSLG